MAWITWIIMFSMHMLFTVSQDFEVESICPEFIHMENVTIECRINSSQIGKTRCFVNPTTVSYIFTTPLGNTSNILCKADFPNTTCDISKSGCGCTSKSGFMYIYNYTFIANQSLHSGVSFKCSIDCFGASPALTQNHNSCAFIKVAPPVHDTTILSSEAPTTDANTKDADCSAGCIAAIIISTVLGIAIIIIIVIIIYKKWIKERIKGNEFLCCCQVHKKHKKCSCGWYPKDKCPSKKTPANTSITTTSEEGPNETKLESVTVTRLVVPKGTKLEPIATPIQEGHKGANLSPIPKLTKTENGGNVQSVYDTMEMQDGNTYLGSNNSPEKKKRRKKKKKKETFQEVGGESVSKEEESNVNGHSATPNDNPDVLYKISQRTNNGQLHESRRLPMPKTSHMTSVERNSMFAESETP